MQCTDWKHEFKRELGLKQVKMYKHLIRHCCKSCHFHICRLFTSKSQAVFWAYNSDSISIENVNVSSCFCEYSPIPSSIWSVKILIFTRFCCPLQITVYVGSNCCHFMPHVRCWTVGLRCFRLSWLWCRWRIYVCWYCVER